MSSGKILMLGDINIDTVWPVSEFPTPGRDGLTETVTVEMGGAVVNSAIVLTTWGIERACWVVLEKMFGLNRRREN